MGRVPKNIFAPPDYARNGRLGILGCRDSEDVGSSAAARLG